MTEGRLGERPGGLQASIRTVPASTATRDFGLALVVALLFLVIGVLSNLIARADGLLAMPWYANAIGIAALVRFALRRWPLFLSALALANLGAEMFGGRSLPEVLPLLVANQIEMVSAAGLLWWTRWHEDYYESPKNLLRLTAVASLLPSLLGVFAGMALAGWQGLVVTQSAWSWFLRDAVGGMTLLPLLLLPQRREPATSWSATTRYWSWAAMSLMLAINVFAFRFIEHPYVLVLLPLLLCGAYLSFRDTTVAIGLASLQICAMHIYDPSMSPDVGGLGGDPRLFLLLLIFGTLVAASGAERARRQAKRHAETEVRWKFALEGAADGVWEWQAATGELSLSSHLQRLLRVSKGTYNSADRSWMAYVHPDDRVRLSLRIAESIHVRDAAIHSDFRVLSRDGEMRWFGARGMVINRDANGQPAQIIGTLSDITVRKNAEAALADSESMLANIIDSAMDAVITTDSDFRIQVFNRAAEAAFGYQAAEVVGRSVQMLVPPESRDLHLHQMASFAEKPKAAISMGGNIRRPIYGLRANGEIFPMESSLSHIESRGKVVYVLIGRDITERKVATDKLIELNKRLEARVEERTRQLAQAKDQAEAANRAKSAFLANMSHEIRTPLNSVLGMTHLALQTETTPKQRDYLEKISISGNHLLGIISDILDFSKIEAGMFEIEAADFGLAECLDKVMQICRLRADAKGLALTQTIAAGVPLFMRGDGLRIGQVLTNLVSNAIKFTDHGQVTLRVRRGGAAPDRGEALPIRFEVEDSGIGIAAETKDKLFNPFQQADASTTRKYGGTGLGLAISRQMVSLMGGRIGVESSLGAGSTFWFEIPLAPSGPDAVERLVETTSPSPVDAARIGLQGKRILLADDHPFNQDVAAEMLHLVGVEVSVAENGRQAVAMAREASFDAVLMDVQMPDMDGYEATRQIRADPRLASLPIIAMTANALKSDRELCLAAGMDDFIAKPISADRLYAVLLSWLAAGERLQPDFPETREMMPDPKLIDLDVLAKIVGSSDPARLEKFIRKFVASTELGLVEMDCCRAAGDSAGFARVGHRIKSVARTVGADRLAQLLQAGEEVGSGVLAAEMAALLARARAEFERIRQHLERSELTAKRPGPATAGNEENASC